MAHNRFNSKKYLQERIYALEEQAHWENTSLPNSLTRQSEIRIKEIKKLAESLK